jgi:sulfoxide reductase heme-binding subunit YedZ
MASRIPPSVFSSKSKTDSLRLLVHLVGLFPLVQLVYGGLTGALTFNPIQFVEQSLGRAALYLFVLTLAVTPMVTLFGWKALSRHRRTLGLYTFFYVALHFLTFSVVDYGMNWGEILRLTVEKPFIIVGTLAGVILLALAVTSFRAWMKRLGKNWKRLHRSIYLAAGLIILHYTWALKGSLTTLKGDIIQPLLSGALIVVLLLLSLPPVKRWIISRNKKASYNELKDKYNSPNK